MNIWLVNNSTFNSTMNNSLELLGLLLVFVIILIATYFASRFIGQSKMGQLRNKNFKVIETYKVAPNKFLQLIKMGNKFVVIAIGKDEIHTVTELSEEEVILQVESEQKSVKFSDLIAKLQRKDVIPQNNDETNDKINMN